LVVCIVEICHDDTKTRRIILVAEAFASSCLRGYTLETCRVRHSYRRLFVMSLLTLKTPLRMVPAMPQRPPQANIPQTLAERERLREIVVRHVDERRHPL